MPPATPTPRRGPSAEPAWGLSFPLLAAAQLAWIPSAAALMALVGVAFAPTYLLVMRTVHQVPAGHELATGLVWGLAATAAYALFCVLFPLLVCALRGLVGARSREGDEPITSPRMFAWYHQLLSTYMVATLCGPFLRATGLYKWFARGMGARIGRGAVLNSLKLYDLDLIDIGERAVIGGDAVLTGHVVEAGRLVRRRVTVGAGATVGLHAVLLPGATVGEGAQVGAMSLVPKGAVLEPHAVHVGVPARRVR